MKTLALIIATLSIVALSGFRAPDPLVPRLAVVRDILTPMRGHVAVADATERWHESGALVALATGLFAAAVLVGRRR